MNLFGATATAIWPKFSEFREDLERIREEDMSQFSNLEKRIEVLDRQNSELLNYIQNYFEVKRQPQEGSGDESVPDYYG